MVGRQTVIVIAMLILLTAVIAVRAIPEGVTVAVGTPETKAAASATGGNVTADGGNVTNVNITAITQTGAWQGFFGEVAANGSITLQDASGDVFFSWNATNLSGEIYASRDSGINFALIKPNNNCSIDNVLTGFGFSDSVNNTFTNNSNVAISVGNVVINASTACAVYTYVNSAPQSTSFNEMILSDDVVNATVGGNTSVYATVINSNTVGFDGATHDYQLLVPVNRTAGTNLYFFFAEIG